MRWEKRSMKGALGPCSTVGFGTTMRAWHWGHSRCCSSLDIATCTGKAQLGQEIVDMQRLPGTSGLASNYRWPHRTLHTAAGIWFPLKNVSHRRWLSCGRSPGAFTSIIR
jgi:hypothetical protein